MSNSRNDLGRLVREVWIEWAREQPNPKASWLLPWEELSEPDREVDRRIGETLASHGWKDAERRIAELEQANRDLERLRAEARKVTEEMREVLVAVKWGGRDAAGHECCPCCGGPTGDHYTDECSLNELLTATEKSPNGE